MSPVVLLLLVTFSSGAGAIAAIDMPSREACLEAKRKMVVEHAQDTDARCIERIDRKTQEHK